MQWLLESSRGTLGLRLGASDHRVCLLSSKLWVVSFPSGSLNYREHFRFLSELLLSPPGVVYHRGYGRKHMFQVTVGNA